MDKSDVQARLQQLEDRVRVLSGRLEEAYEQIARLDRMLADAGIILQPDKDDPANQYGNKIVQAARRTDRNDKLTLLLLTVNKNRSGQPYVKTVYLHKDNSPNWAEFEQMTGIKGSDLPMVQNFDEARQKAVQIPPLLYVEHTYIKTRGDNAGESGTKFHSWKKFPETPAPAIEEKQPVLQTAQAQTPPAPVEEKSTESTSEPSVPEKTPSAPPVDDNWRQKFLQAGQAQGIPLEWLQGVVGDVPDKEAGRQLWVKLMEDVDNLVRHEAENQWMDEKYTERPAGIINIRERMQDYPWMVRTNHKWKRWMILCALDLTLQQDKA